VLSSGKVVGPGGISISGDTLLVNRITRYQEIEAPIAALAAYRLTEEGPEPMWELARKEGSAMSPVHGECIPVVVQGKYVFTADLRVVDLASGKVIDEAKDKNLKPQNGGYMQAMGNMVMTRIDGTHGKIECGFFWLDAAGKIAKAAAWNHGSGMVKRVDKTLVVNLDLHTTSYHHPVYYPMADGRIFIRGGDGIYCWDLRKK
jgi:hypothetical protein